MMNKKGATMSTVFFTVIITIALFFAGYNYININYEQAGVEDTLGYNKSYADINVSQQSLSDGIDDIQESAQGIGEANANVLLIAWNGLTGLAATITVFFDIIMISSNVFQSIFPALAFLPPWVNILATMGIIIWILLIIIGAFKGETKT